jgi:hypothetical protein
MAFLPLLPGSGPAIRVERLRLWTERSGRTLDRRRLNLSISRPLCTRLGWQKGDRVVIAIGLGEDRGKLQIARVERSGAGHRLSGFKQSHVLRAAVTTPVSLQGEDLSPLLDRFLDPGDIAFAVEDGVLVAALTPSAATDVQPARAAPLSVVG